LISLELGNSTGGIAVDDLALPIVIHIPHSDSVQANETAACRFWDTVGPASARVVDALSLTALRVCCIAVDAITD